MAKPDNCNLCHKAGVNCLDLEAAFEGGSMLRFITSLCGSSPAGSHRDTCFINIPLSLTLLVKKFMFLLLSTLGSEGSFSKAPLLW